MNQRVGIVLVAVLAIAVGGVAAWWSMRSASVVPASAVVQASADAATGAVWQASFKDPDGRLQPMAQWRGRPLVLNFWASWCAPCREEMPHFVATQTAFGEFVRFVGLAIDQPEEVKKFLKEIPVNYPVLVGEQDAMALLKAEGNRIGALPYTVIYDAQGRKVMAHAGVMTQAQLESALRPLLGR